MRITFFSNFINHHQDPFCRAMSEQLGEKFKFVSTTPLPTEFKENGYPDYSEQSYCLRMYAGGAETNRCLGLLTESDVVIFGAAPNALLDARIRQGKLTFRIAERLAKKPLYREIRPKFAWNCLRYHVQYRRCKNLFLLCAGAYVANDFELLMSYPGRMLKWGYFPEVKGSLPDIVNNGRLAPKGDTRILWVGRLIELKRPWLAIAAIDRLVKCGVSARLTIIGQGPQLDSLMSRSEALGLSNCVDFRASAPNEVVVREMTESDIFLFTSDRQEGWGAVLNEAMGAGCAVVASNEAGATPFLVEHNFNGLIFDGSDIHSLESAVMNLAENPQTRERLSREAIKTIQGEWSAKAAAARLIGLTDEFLRGNLQKRMPSGPLSSATSMNPKDTLKCLS